MLKLLQSIALNTIWSRISVIYIVRLQSIYLTSTRQQKTQLHDCFEISAKILEIYLICAGRRPAKLLLYEMRRAVECPKIKMSSKKKTILSIFTYNCYTFLLNLNYKKFLIIFKKCLYLFIKIIYLKKERK